MATFLEPAYMVKLTQAQAVRHVYHVLMAIAKEAALTHLRHTTSSSIHHAISL